jgi:hypothetical protein
MKHPRPNLRYVDADDLDDKAVRFRGMEVDSFESDKLGKVEGFIIDTLTGRPYHVVVGAGHWFKHKHFLLPVGHVTLATDYDKLIADVAKNRVERFPGFDKDLFPKMSEEELKILTEQLSAACCPDEVVVAEVSVWDTAHYAYPTWWAADFYRPDRADMAGINVGGAASPTGARVASSGRDAAAGSGYEREQMRASEDADDTSPHMGGRAQPGDVLGVETGGERTYVGDTSDDENKRRRAAEEARKR